MAKRKPTSSLQVVVVSHGDPGTMRRQADQAAALLKACGLPKDLVVLARSSSPPDGRSRTFSPVLQASPTDGLWSAYRLAILGLEAPRLLLLPGQALPVPGQLKALLKASTGHALAIAGRGPAPALWDRLHQALLGLPAIDNGCAVICDRAVLAPFALRYSHGTPLLGSRIASASKGLGHRVVQVLESDQAIGLGQSWGLDELDRQHLKKSAQLLSSAGLAIAGGIALQGRANAVGLVLLGVGLVTIFILQGRSAEPPVR